MSLGERELIAMLPDLTAPLSTARGLPNAAYVDPELFELERHSLLGRTWTAIAYESLMSKVDDALRLHLAL